MTGSLLWKVQLPLESSKGPVIYKFKRESSSGKKKKKINCQASFFFFFNGNYNFLCRQELCLGFFTVVRKHILPTEKNPFIYDQVLTERLLIALPSVFPAFLIISTAFLTYAEEKKAYYFTTGGVVGGKGNSGNNERKS